MWLGTDKVFDAFKFYVARDAVRRDADPRLPVRRDGQHVHRRDARRRLARAPASTRSPTATFAPGRVRREVDRPRSASSSPTSSTATRCMANNSRWISFTTVRNEQLAARQRRAARRRRAHRALLDRLRHQARDGGRARARRLPARAAATSTRRLDGLRGRAPAGRAVHPARRAGQPGVVREPRPVRRPGADAVRVQHHDPQPPRHLRQPAAARPRVRRPRSTRGSPAHEAARGHGDRRRPPADVPAVPAARARAGQPGRRVADGHVLARSTACPTTSTSSTSAARRSAAPAW